MSSKLNVKSKQLILGILLTIAVVFAGIHIFIQQYSTKILEDLVAKESKGKVNVEIGRVRLRLFPNETLDLHNTTFIFKDPKSNSKGY